MTSTSDRERRSQRVLEYLVAAFVLYLVAAALLGALAILGSAFWADATSATAVGPVIVRDLGIALLIGVFVTGSIELYAARRLREEVATDVITATFHTLVSAKIYAEIRDNVLQSTVIRRGWEVNMSVVDPVAEHELYDQVRTVAGGDIYLVDSEVSYDVVNTTGKQLIYDISGGIDLDTPLTDLGIPRFSVVSIDHAATQIDDAVSMAVLGNGTHHLDGLDLSVVGGQLVFVSPKRIPASGKLAVRFKLRRAFRAPGQFVLSATVPTEGFRLRIYGGNDLSFNLIALHPNKEDLVSIDSREWRFESGILPWQGFALRASKVASLPSAHAPEPAASGGD
jgi:hypothetical protein